VKCTDNLQVGFPREELVGFIFKFHVFFPVVQMVTLGKCIRFTPIEMANWLRLASTTTLKDMPNTSMTRHNGEVPEEQS